MGSNRLSESIQQLTRRLGSMVRNDFHQSVRTQEIAVWSARIRDSVGIKAEDIAIFKLDFEFAVRLILRKANREICPRKLINLSRLFSPVKDLCVATVNERGSAGLRIEARVLKRHEGVETNEVKR